MGSGMCGPSDTVKLILLSSYEVCSRPDHYIGGELKLRRNGSCVPVLFNGTIGNPPVDLEGVLGINVVYLDEIEAEPIDTDLYQGQTQMLVTKKSLNDTVVCESLTYGPGLIPVVYAKYYGKWYVHSPRFQLLGNTPTTALLDGGASIVNTTSGGDDIHKARCANVAPSFLNEDSCFLSTEPSTCAVEGSVERNLVCGSPSEIPNDVTLGGTQFNGAFGMEMNWADTATQNANNKKNVWSSVVFSAPDQLRQRMAWALSQILVINDASGGDFTEQYATYSTTFSPSTPLVTIAIF